MSPLLLWVLRLVGFHTGGSGGMLVNFQPLESFSVRNMIFVVILTLGSIWGLFYMAAKTFLHLCSVCIGLFVPYYAQFATYGVFGILDTKFLEPALSSSMPESC